MKYSLKLFPGSSHVIIAQMLHERKANSILDLGCSDGFLGEALVYKPKLLVGVDNKIDSTPKGYNQLLKADLEKDLIFPYSFDSIVLADVLEHLDNPSQLLEKIGRYLKKRGFLAISVPNMDFFLVRLIRLVGARPKMEKGFFDKTHKQEFNLRKVKELLNTQGYFIEELAFTPLPLPLISKTFNQGSIFYPLFRALTLITSVFPAIFAYQIIVIAKKDEK